MNFTPTALCVACLSSGRKLNLVIDGESKQLFCDFIDNLEFSNYPIPLCYECTCRLKSIISFKKQVKIAHKFLIGYTIQSEPPTSLSKLQFRNTEIFDWEPNTLNALDLYSNRSSKDNRENTNNYVNTENSDNEDFSNSCNDTEPVYFLDIDINHKLKKDRTYNDVKPVSHEPALQVKVENASDNHFDIKDEPFEENTWKCRKADVQLKVENRNDGFSDSDDEPLKTKKTRSRKIVKSRDVGLIPSRGAAESRERASGVVTGVWVQRKLQKLNVPPGLLEMVVLSWDEVQSERHKSLEHVTYTRHQFRCQSCIVGFNHRFKLDTHMKKHQPEAGDLECNICTTRFKNQCALKCHLRRHRSRWRCTVCNATFSRADIAADHHAKAHGAPLPTHTCHVCQQKETSLYKLRIHLKSHAEKQHCEQCGKTFRDKSSLKTHLFIHTNQKDFACEVCDKRFRFKKALEIHQVTHQAPELLYCQDCDMNFKNQHSFYQHMKYSMKHIHPDKIKYACEFCERRFSKPARLEEHRMSIHLKLAPHRCVVEGCTFASASRPALRTHIRMVHRNKRLERNHICHECGKAYTTKKILEGHIRSHTGERPFTCSKCPATFSHDAALYNHNKLVHKIPFVRRLKPNQRETQVPASLPVPSDWPVQSEAPLEAGSLDNEALA